jgi:general L-amino acid transport system permease protein
MAVITEHRGAATGSLWRNEYVRGIAIQVLAIVILAGVGGFLVHNTAVNLAKRGIASGFGFLSNQAGFDIGIALIPYTMAGSSYLQAFLVSVVNTLVVSAVGIVIATILGFVIGIARLSRNWLVATLAAVYVDAIRNIPLLAQIIFWYFGLLPLLPQVRQSVPVFNAFFFSNRGLYMPKPELLPGFWMVPAALVVGIALAIVLHRWAKRRQAATGQLFPSVLSGLGLAIGVPLLVMLVSGSRVDLSMPELKGFNFQGGMVVVPEFLALLLALSIYTAAFIAENVRSGILAVSHGQTEAALALGLKSSFTLRLVVVPQALRVIVPPLTSQYLNLVKNSTLGTYIAYPDVVQVFAGTVVNQTGQAVEGIAITMAFYLAISLLISAAMNWYNRHVALVER